MERKRSGWLPMILWADLTAVAVVLLQAALVDQTDLRQIAVVLGCSLIYANVCAAIALGLAALLARRPALMHGRRLLLLVLITAVAAAAGCLLAQGLLMLFQVAPADDFWQVYLRTVRTAVPLSVLVGAIAIVYSGLRQRLEGTEHKLRDTEMRESTSRELLARARLEALESRIHPHFLFNTLNSISALIRTDPARAEQVVDKLAVLLRASLDSSAQPLIPLREELRIVRSYIEIQQVRFGSRLRATFDVPAALEERKVPPMSLQALVENAVKHGLAMNDAGGEVWISASADGATLRVEIRDSGPGFDLSAVRAGHGLDNLSSRLHALFGDAARLDVHRRGGQCVAELVLPMT